jgi:undecaprenyl-diphosphatase
MINFLKKLNLNPKPKNLQFFRWGMILFTGFILVSLFEFLSLSSQYDPEITIALQRFFPRSVDIPFSLFSLIGTFEITTFIVFIILLVILRVEKKILWSSVFYPMILVYELIGKFFLYHPGPPRGLFRYSLPFHLSTVHIATNYAFPSGHMSRTMFLVVILAFLITRYFKNIWQRRALLALAIVFTITMAISRIYLGEHWTSDVVGGFFLGGSMGLLTLVYF